MLKRFLRVKFAEKTTKLKTNPVLWAKISKNPPTCRKFPASNPPICPEHTRTKILASTPPSVSLFASTVQGQWTRIFFLLSSALSWKKSVVYLDSCISEHGSTLATLKHRICCAETVVKKWTIEFLRGAPFQIFQKAVTDLVGERLWREARIDL